MPDLLEVDRGQGFAIIAARSRHAMALDDGAGGFSGDAEAFGDLSVGEVFDRHDDRKVTGWCPRGDRADARPRFI